jgi:hypothetical protein
MQFNTCCSNVNVLGEDKGCLVTCQAGTKGRIAVPILDLGARRGWFVNPMPRPFYLGEGDPVSIVHEGGWALGLVWMGLGNLAPTGVRALGLSSLYIACCYTDYTIPVNVNMLPVTNFILPETSLILSSIYKNAL